jgi:hypothetical protein
MTWSSFGARAKGLNRIEVIGAIAPRMRGFRLNVARDAEWPEAFRKAASDIRGKNSSFQL